MGSEILINRTLGETRVAKIENGQLVELHVERESRENVVGNIYKGRINRVLPGMQAAFVDIGLSRTGFLHASQVLDPQAARKIEPDEPDSEGAPTEDENEDDKPAHTPDVRSISELTHEGAALLVQVLKEPMGTKGARLTGFISIPGRYLVFMPDSPTIGISRRIENNDERDRLREIVEKNMPKQGGFIIRTVAEGASAKHLKDDMEYLIKLWGSIKKAAEKAKPGECAYQDLDIMLKVIRDRVTDDVERVVIDDLESFKRLNKFIQNFMPRFKKRIVLHTDSTPLFDQYGIEVDIKRACARKVWLKSGGYIVIDQTEALTSIDVNTGRFVGRRNLEETIMQTNMEAVKEVAYQIRLRNIGGIIVVDFIDMIKQQFRERVYQTFVEEMARDPARTNVLPLSELGLVEMTRKRTQGSLLSKLTAPCRYCEGRGYVKSRETLAFEILRVSRKEAQAQGAGKRLNIYCHPEVAEFFAGEERSLIEDLEKELDKQVSIKVDPQLHLEDYEIFTREA